MLFLHFSPVGSENASIGKAHINYTWFSYKCINVNKFMEHYAIRPLINYIISYDFAYDYLVKFEML